MDLGTNTGRTVEEMAENIGYMYNLQSKMDYRFVLYMESKKKSDAKNAIFSDRADEFCVPLI